MEKKDILSNNNSQHFKLEDPNCFKNLTEQEIIQIFKVFKDKVFQIQQEQYSEKEKDINNYKIAVEGEKIVQKVIIDIFKRSMLYFTNKAEGKLSTESFFSQEKREKYIKDSAEDFKIVCDLFDKAGTKDNIKQIYNVKDKLLERKKERKTMQEKTNDDIQQMYVDEKDIEDMLSSLKELFEAIKKTEEYCKKNKDEIDNETKAIFNAVKEWLLVGVVKKGIKSSEISDILKDAGIDEKSFFTSTEDLSKNLEKIETYLQTQTSNDERRWDMKEIKNDIDQKILESTTNYLLEQNEGIRYVLSELFHKSSEEQVFKDLISGEIFSLDELNRVLDKIDNNLSGKK